MPTHDEVDYVSGRTRVFGIVGHPIEQVRSPEMFTAEFRRRGRDAILVPLHVLPDDFDAVLPQLLRLANLGGLVFTIPYKARACALADVLGAQAQVVGAINALVKGADGRWQAEIFDGLGCVEAFRRRAISFTGKRVMLLGAGGAGSAIAVAVGHERPASLRIYDVDAGRATALAARVARANPGCRRDGRRGDDGGDRHPAQCVAGGHARRRAVADCKWTRCRANSSSSTRSSSPSARRCLRWRRPAAARRSRAAK